MYHILRKIKKLVRRQQLANRLKKSPETFPLLYKKELAILMDGHPYIHDDEVALLAKIASQQSGPIVEIGCAFGASSAVWLLHSRPGTKLHSIDPFVVDSMAPFRATAEKCRGNVLRILKFFKRQSKFADWSLHQDFSFNVVKNWTEPIDVIFIDGDHTYPAVKQDFEDWYPLVKTGGLILFHDSRKETGTDPNTFNRGWAGPTKLAEELKTSSQVKLVDEAFSITVWQKI